MLVTVMLTGCTINVNVPSNGGKTDFDGEARATIAQGAQSDGADNVNENAGANRDDNVGKIEGVSFEVLTDEDKGMNCGSVKWILDGSNKEFQSSYDVRTELENVQDIGLVGEDKYYFISHGVLYIVNLRTCETIEAGKEIGASCSWDFDDNNNIYICGYYGPRLVIISPDGKEISHFNILDTDDYISECYYWPYELDYSEGYVYVTYDSVGGRLKINPSDGTAEMVDLNDENVGFFSGSWTMTYFNVEDSTYGPDEYECSIVFDENMNMSLVMKQEGEVTHKFDNISYEFHYCPELSGSDGEYFPFYLIFKPDEKNEIQVTFGADLYSMNVTWREVLSDDFTITKIMSFMDDEWLQYNEDLLNQ